MTKIRSISSRVSIGLRAKAVFGVIFAVVGLGIIIWLSVLPILRYLDAQDWEETPCTILHSQVSSNRSSDGTTYSIDIRYRYEFKGREYRSSRYSFLKLSSSGYAAKQAVVNRHRARSRARCYVDPDNPSQAVLSTEFSFGYLFGLMGFFFFVPGCLAVFASLRQGKGSSLISRGGLGFRQRLSDESLSHRASADGEITLKPSDGPMKKFLFILAFCLIWNGVIWFMLYSNTNRGFGGFMSVFFLPFILIGLALIGGLLHTFLALFNPKTELKVCPGAMPLASLVDLEWTFLGSPRRIRQFRITLEGKESATYQRGTTTRTEHSVFERLVVVESDSPRDMLTGKVQFAVPEYSVPSFQASHNKITWYLKVHGDIPKWPDINEEYEVQVLPLSSH